MARGLWLLFALCALSPAPAGAAEPAPTETVQSDVSTREISIQSNFAGIEIVIFGSIDFSHALAPDEGNYDVITVIRSPAEPIVVRRKEQVAGIWVNRAGRTFKGVPGFYAVLGTRPFKAITTEDTLKQLGVGFSNLEFGKNAQDDATVAAYRSALTRLKQDQNLFQEHDDGVTFIGRSLFRASVDLPANVPLGRYTTDVYLFRDGHLISKSEGTLEVSQAGFERAVSLLARDHPFVYGLAAVTIAVMIGLFGWVVFRRD
ncbi:TIGR02186 family protein [Methyloceanibacter sp.]|uniref:TIGR02186 family protein n=1 Tax=Methyloceanibacter sp. TaxID=1965321 RepID=UPI002D40A07E|nr:TIGR02186 family protein [Methyloceanibacter sp.]HZP09331.1 TIGR02186 family protein [Methyloceanibacter sp.]